MRGRWVPWGGCLFPWGVTVRVPFRGSWLWQFRLFWWGIVVFRVQGIPWFWFWFRTRTWLIRRRLCRLGVCRSSRGRIGWRRTCDRFRFPFTFRGSLCRLGWSLGRCCGRLNLSVKIKGYLVWRFGLWAGRFTCVGRRCGFWGVRTISWGLCLTLVNCYWIGRRPDRAWFFSSHQTT